MRHVISNIFGLFSVVAQGHLLASSDFLFGNDGWRVTSEDTFEVQLETRSSALYGRDTGDSGVWYFEAPGAYLGEKSTAYAGSLSFRRSHSQYVDRATPVLDEWDVIISSETYGIRLGSSLSKLRRLEHTLALTNEAGPVWTNIDAGHVASKFELVRVLHDLTSLRIRGGIYGGAEEVWLAMVRMMQGDDSPQHAQLVRRYVSDALNRDREESADLPDQEDALLDVPTGSGDGATQRMALDPERQPGAVGPNMESNTPRALTDERAQMSATERRTGGSNLGVASIQRPSRVHHRELVEREAYVRVHSATPWHVSGLQFCEPIQSCCSLHVKSSILPISHTDTPRICRIGKPIGRHQEAFESRYTRFTDADKHVISDSHAGWFDRQIDIISITAAAQPLLLATCFQPTAVSDDEAVLPTPSFEFPKFDSAATSNGPSISPTTFGRSLIQSPLPSLPEPER
jgi:hypothetical protein